MVGSSENGKSFADCLPHIFKAVNELRMAIGEKFISADLAISVFDYDMAYDPSCMDVAYGDGRRPSSKRAPDTIIGTTGIGLKKLVVEHGGSKDALRFQNVISAKVVLRSTLTEALEPVKPSRLKKLKKPVVEVMDGADTGGSRGISKVDNMDVTHG